MNAQTQSALELANETRMAGVEFRRELRGMGQADAVSTAARVIGHGANGPLSSQFVEQLLRAVPGFGPQRVGTLLEQAQIRARAHVRDLSDPQRSALVDALHNPPPLRPPAPPPAAPGELPSAPLAGWIERHYGTPEAAAKVLGMTARSLRRMQSAEHVHTQTVEDLLTRAPIGMHDLYPPEKYPGLYA